MNYPAYPGRSPEPPATPTSKPLDQPGRHSLRWIVALVAVTVCAIGVLASTTDPPTIVVPNFAGKDCKASQASLDRLVRTYEAWQRDTMAADSPSICTGNVVIRTEPAAGTEIDPSANDGKVEVSWWAIEREAYDWYREHPTMPDYTKKSFGSDDADEPALKYFVEERDHSLLSYTDAGYYEQAEHLIMRTDPAPGEPLSMGQRITFYTQVQRGQWKPLEGDTGSEGRDNWHAGACVGVWIFHGCVH